MTMRALEAAGALRKDGIGAPALHPPTIKPPDETTIIAEAPRTGRTAVAAENHTVTGALGEAVAGVLLRSNARPAGVRPIGLPGAFLDAGALPTLHDRYGISPRPW
jgi:transketolase